MIDLHAPFEHLTKVDVLHIIIDEHLAKVIQPGAVVNERMNIFHDENHVEIGSGVMGLLIYGLILVGRGKEEQLIPVPERRQRLAVCGLVWAQGWPAGVVPEFQPRDRTIGVVIETHTLP
jgi:hypothetical protein